MEFTETWACGQAGGRGGMAGMRQERLSLSLCLRRVCYHKKPPKLFLELHLLLEASQ